jgi:hypothetical protein
MENTTSSSAQSYDLTPPVDAFATHVYGEVLVVPAAVVRCFGGGEFGDGEKVSRQWVFRKGELVFSVYDWKCTNLYDPDAWDPEELWASECPYPLHVGSREPATEQDAREFAEWLVTTTKSASSQVD